MTISTETGEKEERAKNEIGDMQVIEPCTFTNFRTKSVLFTGVDRKATDLNYVIFTYLCLSKVLPSSLHDVRR